MLKCDIRSNDANNVISKLGNSSCTELLYSMRTSYYANKKFDRKKYVENWQITS